MPLPRATVIPKRKDCLDRASQSILTRKEPRVARFAHIDLEVCVLCSSQSSGLDISGWSLPSPTAHTLS